LRIDWGNIKNYVSGAKNSKIPSIGDALREIEGEDRFKKRGFWGGQALKP
jgi:hypothetical protein